MDYLQQRQENLKKLAQLTHEQLSELAYSCDPRAQEFVEQCVVEERGQMRVSAAALMSSDAWRYAENDHPATLLARSANN